MSYYKADHILPAELLAEIQKYVDGTCLYIPRKDTHKRAWGSTTDTREVLKARNAEIRKAYCEGHSKKTLSDRYFLSLKSIERIVRGG